MNHRRRKAMRFVKLLWITKEPRRALVFYLINTPLPKSGFLACISSRITTGIQVVRYYQINDNWFNEPFAVSLYRLLILRHAWLNLWDKHMTTGRINQVTIFIPRVREDLEETPKIGAEQFMEGWNTRSIGAPERRLRQGPLDHPIAPTKFPKGRSATQEL